MARYAVDPVVTKGVEEVIKCLGMAMDVADQVQSAAGIGGRRSGMRLEGVVPGWRGGGHGDEEPSRLSPSIPTFGPSDSGRRPLGHPL